jgi:hypothetical protein
MAFTGSQARISYLPEYSPASVGDPPFEGRLGCAKENLLARVLKGVTEGSPQCKR